MTIAFARVGTLARGFLSRRPAPERAVELIEECQTHLWATECGAQPIVILCIKLSEHHSRPLLYQLVQTHTSRPREVLESLCLVARARLEPAAVFQSVSPISLQFSANCGIALRFSWDAPGKCPHSHMAARESPWTSLHDKTVRFDGFSRDFFETSRCYRTSPEVYGVGTAVHRILNLSA